MNFMGNIQDSLSLLQENFATQDGMNVQRQLIIGSNTLKDRQPDR